MIRRLLLRLAAWLEERGIIGETIWDLDVEDEAGKRFDAMLKRELEAWAVSASRGRKRMNNFDSVTPHRAKHPEVTEEEVAALDVADAFMVECRKEFERQEKGIPCPRCNNTREDPEHQGACGECGGWWPTR
jgi:hypothetical protein